mmetsp:Transcript_26086/g.66464  ORF Transcript_26086/g.66464 Transcript_26086/m.66464 type:complete len:219 (+) Transcript_26086:510-1166(+)
MSWPKLYHFMFDQSFAAFANSISALSLLRLPAFGMCMSTSRPPPEPRALMESISMSFCSRLMPHFSNAAGAWNIVKATAVPHCIFSFSFRTFACLWAKNHMTSAHADWKNLRFLFTQLCRSTWIVSGAWSTSPGILMSAEAPSPNMPRIRPAETLAMTSLRGIPSGRPPGPASESRTLRAALPKFRPNSFGSPFFQASRAVESSLMTSWPFAMKWPET